MDKKRLIVITGPTAVGKTALAVLLAHRWKTEIISADSRQIYKEIEIGTAKPTAAELVAINHSFVNTQSIETDYDAGQFGRDALAMIGRLFVHHDYVILCGGSGLYIKAVCDGFDDMPDVAPEMRNQINTEYRENGLVWLQDQVKKNDPEYFDEVDQQNPQRLIRALELYYSTGRVMSDLRKRKKLVHPFSIIKIGLSLDREILYQRIDDRVDTMLESGLVEEARGLYPFRNLNALQTVGYAEIFGYFDGQYDLAEAVRLIKRNTRNYAKRQMTWFGRDKEIKWFKPYEVDAIAQICEGDAA